MQIKTHRLLAVSGPFLCKMETKSASAESSGSRIIPRIIIKKELQSLIETVKKIQSITTYEEVLDGLKVYIWQRKLYDPRNPFKICCHDDELGSVLGAKEFTIFDVKFFLQKLVLPVKSFNYSEGSSSVHLPSDNSSVHFCHKRKCDDNLDSVEKKISHVEQSVGSSSPMILQIPSSPAKHDSSSDSAQSVQGYETAYVKDTSDDVLSVDSDVPHERILAIEETYNLEYEIETDSSTSSSSFDSDSCDSEINFLHSQPLSDSIFALVCKTDSDIEFFADDSSSADSEIPESDRWECKTCMFDNDPTMRKCSKCWSERQGWLPDKSSYSDQKPPLRKKKRKTKSKSSNDSSKTEDLEESSSSPAASSAIEENPSALHEESTSKDVSLFRQCIICCSRPANASIIHGKIGHQISCYRCAANLRRKKQRCPICRRIIERVVQLMV